MKKTLSLLSIILILFTSCKRKESFLIRGSTRDGHHKYVYLSRIDISSVVPIDSAIIGMKGNFFFRVKAKEPDFYQLGYSSADFITLLANPGEKISIVLNGSKTFNNYSVTGSEGSSLIRIIDYKLIDTKNKLDSLSSLYQIESGKPGFETKKQLLEQEYRDIVKEQRKFNIGFILRNTKSLSIIKAIYQRINDQTYVLYDPHDLQYLKIAADSLKRYYPESRHTKSLISDFEKKLNQFYGNQLKQLARTLPEAKLDPYLKDLYGKRIALSSLKGKYVLLSFWSSDSRDCIVENLQFKEYYRMFHSKGFEIYQINLDTSESAWRTAVKFDELPWINTREDDPDNPKNARLFNVRLLPSNFLFDQKGNIIASDLHGRNLQLKLDQIFKN
ncbi:MAG: TlpA disulfide reductase family protein [Bacteroidales bacterium]|jgi:hypothetical protein